MGITVIKSKFFAIDLYLLGEDEIPFPFTIFLKEIASGRHAPFLYAKSPFTQEVQVKLKELISKGFELQISLAEKDNFLRFTEKTAQEIHSLSKTKNEWELLQESRQNKYKNDLAQSYPFVDEFSKAILSQNFNPMIERTKIEILQFPYQESQTVSNAINIAEKLLKPDEETSKIISCCYHLAKKMNYKETEDLSDLICAAAFRDVGASQLTKGLYTHLSTLSDEDLNEWQKHPALSVFLLKKGNIQLSDRSLRLILEHHERFDGTGFPRKKLANFIDPLAELLGFVEHVFHFSSGKMTGRKSELSKTFKAIVNQHHQDGLDLRFSPGLISLISALTQNI